MVHAVAAVAGTVPDGDEAPGTPLTVSKAAGNDIMLAWAASSTLGMSEAVRALQRLTMRIPYYG